MFRWIFIKVSSWLLSVRESGKSTLLQLLGGLDRPTSVTVSIEETYLDTLSDSELSRFRNQTVGLVFQSFYLQPFFDAASQPRGRRHASSYVAKWTYGTGYPTCRASRVSSTPASSSARAIWWTNSARRYRSGAGLHRSAILLEIGSNFGAQGSQRKNS